jgi:carboxyl-terminal processing protease
LPIRALRYLRPDLRPACVIAWAAFLVTLAACAGQGSPQADAGGQLFARGLDQIAGLYLEPVTSRRLALSGAARLARLDDKLGVSDGLGAVALAYDGRDIGFFATPSDTSSREWGQLIATLIATAKEASPRLAALPQETIDTAVLSGMAAALDRFSHYSAPEMARDQRAARDGFGGIGVTLDTTDPTFRVTAVTPQGPADRAGIEPEDHIVAIDGVATAGGPGQDVVHQLRGPIGSPIAVRVQHPGTAQPRDIPLHRAYVVLPTVTLSRDGNIAVFRIASFNQSTTQRITQGLAEAERQSGGRLAGIVLDLRGNPGGLLDQAVSHADLFIHDGPIAATVGRHPASRQYFAAAGDSIAPHVPLVVLINGGSASASEIVAAALQDAGRAVVVGSSSYGKGTVQTVLRLPNDGELIVTWARLVAPAGYLLQTHGVVPTLWTADLGDDERSLDVGLQRVSAVSGLGSGAGLPARPRAALDGRGWSDLRRSCPPGHTSPAIDLKLAKRMLADPKLYGEALNMLPAAIRVAERAPSAGRAEPALPKPASTEPALTDVDGALSSPSR